MSNPASTSLAATASSAVSTVAAAASSVVLVRSTWSAMSAWSASDRDCGAKAGEMHGVVHGQLQSQLAGRPTETAWEREARARESTGTAGAQYRLAMCLVAVEPPGFHASRAF